MNNAPTMPSADRTPEHEVQLRWLDGLTRYRRSIYAFVVLFYIACFNGIWRIGVDSALYRGLARSLVRGEGYKFAGEHHQHAYPGLPWMLAALERVFGDSAVPGLILLTLMAIATLWLVDRMISLRYPTWVAMVVTIGMAFNVRFVTQSQQLMTDVPFTLGVVATFYALERLRLVPLTAKWTTFASWATALIAALGLAVSTRPTFAVLVLAIVFASFVRALRGTDGRRWLHVSILVAAGVVMLGLFVVAPRMVGGRYELELIERVNELPRTLPGQLRALLGNDLNDAFFSQRLSPINYLGSLLILIASVIVARRNLAWGLTIFGIIVVTLPLSTVPRYYLMVMPFLWLGWTLLWSHVTVRVPRMVQGPLLMVALLLPMSANVGRSVDVLLEQRRPDIAWLRDGTPREEAFYATYRNGVVPKQRQLAKMIADHSTRDHKIIGPDAHVLAYLADRNVVGERALFIDREESHRKLPALLARMQPDMAIFPMAAYGENDALMRELIRYRVLVARRELAKIDGATLAEAVVRQPPPGTNWKSSRAQSATTRITAAQRAEANAKRERRAEREAKLKRAERLERQAKIAKRERQERLEKRERIERRERAEKRERQERRERRERQSRNNVPSTTPSTKPSTTPA